MAHEMVHRGSVAGRREWAGLAVLALPTLLLSLDVSVLYLALPQLTRELGADGNEQLWIMDIYSFMIAGFLVTMGSLGDRIGRRKLLLIGAAVFGVASVFAAYATSAAMLIAARALLGISGATLMPSTLALISNMFTDAKQRGFAIAVWMSCFMGGMAVGPVIGGALLAHFWWGSAFLLAVPVMLVLLVAGPLLLPEFPQRSDRDPAASRLDLTSVVLSLAAILPVIYGLKELARGGVAGVPVATVAVGVVFGWAFLRRQQTLPHPLLDLRLFANRGFRTGLGVTLPTGIVMAGISLLATMYIQLVVGLPAWQAGLWLVPQNVALMIGSLAAPALARRFTASRVIVTGLATAGVGVLLLTRVGTGDGLAFLVGGMVLAGGGVTVMMSLITDLILSAAPPEKAGSASALSETSGEFGIAAGVAILGSLATVVYRSHLAGHLPAGVPSDAAGAAEESLAGAVTAASQLPDPVGSALVDSAQAAFTAGFTTVAAIGGVGFLGLAVLAAVGLRRRPNAGTAPAPAPAAGTATGEKVLVGAVS